jgi:hypothetical protein
MKVVTLEVDEELVQRGVRLLGTRGAEVDRDARSRILEQLTTMVGAGAGRLYGLDASMAPTDK